MWWESPGNTVVSSPVDTDPQTFVLKASSIVTWIKSLLFF